MFIGFHYWSKNVKIDDLELNNALRRKLKLYKHDRKVVSDKHVRFAED